MELLTTLGTLGSVASIASAGFAWYKASQSKKYANKSKIIQDELISHRKIAELSKIHTETHRILRVVSRIGPSCSPSSIRGVKVEDIAKEVVEFSQSLNENRSHFAEHLDNHANELCAHLRPIIVELSEAKSFEDKKKHGMQIYDLINGFLPHIKKLVDSKKEQTKMA